jgi:hypothetical protein
MVYELLVVNPGLAGSPSDLLPPFSSGSVLPWTDTGQRRLVTEPRIERQSRGSLMDYSAVTAARQKFSPLLATGNLTASGT